MSTPENPETPPLTRRQLRELRQTGATPIITPQPAGDEQDAGTPAAATQSPVVDRVPEPVVAEEPAVAEPAVAEPAAEEPTAVEPAVTAPAVAEEPLAPEEPVSEQRDEAPAPAIRPAVLDAPYADAGAEFGVSGLTRRQVRAQEKIRTAAVPIISPDLEPALPHQPVVPAATADEADLPAIFRPAAPEETAVADAPTASVVNPALGSDLLDGQVPEVTLPASFDQLISRSTGATGAISTPNALILSQTPNGVPLVGPVTATGEVMITGTFELPEGLGSIGHAPGTTDGRDADAVLLDGELPPASSPTPIAASAAISTVKQPGEIIRPPAPEKGSKLLVGLIITTGALALAVAVTLVLAFTTGVFR